MYSTARFKFGLQISKSHRPTKGGGGGGGGAFVPGPHKKEFFFFFRGEIWEFEGVFICFLYTFFDLFQV